jgi:ribosomal protein L11 methyltransferase
MEIENGFEAYAEQDNFNKEVLHEILQKYSAITPITFYQDKIEKINWNEEWEKNYEPVMVDDSVIIRASFHQPTKSYPYDIIITPKMSFGTGHHQTTHLMVKTQLEMDHKNKIVMDAGCGTAVLAIMASKLGAKKVEAFDIDEWSVINGQENAEINQCANINIRQGKISDLTFEDDFDIILANINKNILLQEMHQYAAYLKPGGLLLLSGFYEKDIPDLLKAALPFKLQQVTSHERESWVSLLLKKK